jgi:ribosomal protein S6
MKQIHSAAARVKGTTIKDLINHGRTWLSYPIKKDETK